MSVLRKLSESQILSRSALTWQQRGRKFSPAGEKHDFTEKHIFQTVMSFLNECKYGGIEIIRVDFFFSLTQTAGLPGNRFAH